MMKNCFICQELTLDYSNFFDKEYSKLISKKQNIILETKNFAIIPSIGALNESHIMICPKEHFISFSSIPYNLNNELMNIITKLNIYCLNKTNKKLILFEHGTGKNQNSGACISHAHLHCVYENKNFENQLFSSINMIKLSSYNDIQNITDQFNGYIFYKNSEESWISNNPKIKSQFFRKLYVNSTNTKLNWNWRIAPNYQIISKVIKFYKEFKEFYITTPWMMNNIP